MTREEIDGDLDDFEPGRSLDFRHRARPAVGALIATLACALVLGMVFLTVQTYGIANSIQEGQDQIDRANVANEESRTSAVDDLTVVAIIAAACATGTRPKSIEQIEKCVRAGLRAEEATSR